MLLIRKSPLVKSKPDVVRLLHLLKKLENKKTLCFGRRFFIIHLYFRFFTENNKFGIEVVQDNIQYLDGK